MTDHTLSKPVENPDLIVLSLGAGVQSTVLALMAAKGLITPMPDVAIFADTGWEPVGVYEHLDWLAEILPFPVKRISVGNIRNDTLEMTNTTGQSRRGAAIPMFVDGGGIGMRQCTNEYKIQPIVQAIRGTMGLKKGERAPKDAKIEQWIGISTDEIVRMKEGRLKYIIHRWPLIEEDMSRISCLKWFADNYPGRVLSKSACIGCPFHDNNAWREMKLNDPVSFADAVEFDMKIRDGGAKVGKMNKQQFLHRSCKPLGEVDFSNAEDRGQLTFLDECEGMCGV